MARKRKQDDPLAALMKTATKAQLVDLLVRVSASRPVVKRECLDYLNRHTALSPSRKNQSEGEKLLALWDELAPDLDELDAYGGGDYDADFHVSSLLQDIAQVLSRKKIEAPYKFPEVILKYYLSGLGNLKTNAPRKEYTRKAKVMKKVHHMLVDVLHDAPRWCDFAIKVKQDNIKRPAFQEEFTKAIPGWQALK